MHYLIFRLFTFSFLIFGNLYLVFLFGDQSHFQNQYFVDYIWIGSIYLLAYYTHRLMTRRMVTTNEMMIMLKSNFIALFAIFFVVVLAKLGDSVSRGIILSHFILNGFNPLWMYVIKKKALTFTFLRKPVFVVCDRNGYENVQKWFAPQNPFGYDIAVTLNVDEEPIILIHKKIDLLLKNKKYHAAIIDINPTDIHEVNNLIDHIQKNLHRVILLPKISRIPIINGELISSIYHKGMAFYIKNNLLSVVDRTTKIIFDYILSILLITLFIPILFLLFVVVTIDTKGSPLFTHRRLGQRGEEFNVWKFRTMYVDAHERLENILETCEESKSEWEKNFKLKNDPRVTPIGRFLRKTSLDELPQLINVLKGEMSLVGPRPIIKDEVAKYGDFYDYFTAVKPGITGLWQVSGRNDINYEERVQLDVWYVRNWSIQLDLEILIKTVLVVLMRKGSY